MLINSLDKSQWKAKNLEYGKNQHKSIAGNQKPSSTHIPNNFYNKIAHPKSYSYAPYLNHMITIVSITSFPTSER